MAFYEHSHFRMSRKLLMLVGQWPYDDHNTKYFLRAAICIPCIILVLTEIYEITNCNAKFRKIIQTLPYIAFELAIFLKYCNCWIKLGAIKDILERIKFDWEALRSEGEVEIMKKHAANGWILGKAYVLIAFTVLVGFVSLSFVPIILDIIRPLNESRKEKILSQAGYLTNTHGYSFYILLHCQCACVVGVTAITASDLCYIMLLYHGCGLYGTVGYRSEHLFDDLPLISNDCKRAVFSTRIADIVASHLRIIDYEDLVTRCYIVSYAMQFFVAVVAIATSLVNLHEWLLAKEHILVLGFILEVLCYYALIFLDIAPGQRLTDESSELFQKLYNGNWYQAPLKTQKLLLLMLQRTQKPFVLSAAGILDMTYKCWATILQTSLSYFMVISSVRK